MKKQEGGGVRKEREGAWSNGNELSLSLSLRAAVLDFSHGKARPRLSLPFTRTGEKEKGGLKGGGSGGAKQKRNDTAPHNASRATGCDQTSRSVPLPPFSWSAPALLQLGDLRGTEVFVSRRNETQSAGDDEGDDGVVETTGQSTSSSARKVPQATKTHLADQSKGAGCADRSNQQLPQTPFLRLGKRCAFWRRVLRHGTWPHWHH